MAGVHKG